MAAKKDVSKFRLIAQKGDNCGGVAGDYSLTETTVNGKSIWISESISRMAFYAGQSWVITSTAYMKDVLGGATGGFASSNNANVPYEADWGPNFDVSEVYLTVEKKFVPATDVYGSPSVHIWWSAPKHPDVQQQGVTWFYNRVEVTVPAESTYFMTNGFTGGYVGIQDRSPKWVLFSVWNNPKVSDGAVKELARGEGATVRPFGGEGTGLQSYLEYDWKVGDTYELIVNVRQDAQDKEKAVYTAWFRLPEKSIWRMLSSLQVSPLSGKMSLEGLYSFIEDWAGNGLRRQGLYGSAWIRTDAGPWVEATHGAGTTTGPNAKNRNVFLSDDKTRLGMTTGGPDLSDTSLGPYDVVETSVPTVLTLNHLPDRDGAPARE